MPRNSTYGKPSCAGPSAGNSSSGTLVSCKQITSGSSAAISSLSSGSRSRSELMFQVAMRSFTGGESINGGQGNLAIPGQNSKTGDNTGQSRETNHGHDDHRKDPGARQRITD